VGPPVLKRFSDSVKKLCDRNSPRQGTHAGSPTRYGSQLDTFHRPGNREPTVRRPTERAEEQVRATMAAASIKEVARHARVSIGTVSNVLNRPDAVSPT